MMTDALPEDIGGIPHGAHLTDEKFGKIMHQIHVLGIFCQENQHNEIHINL